MKPYHKINAPFKRDKQGNILVGDWAMPEFEYLAPNPWQWTLKVDGTNIRVRITSSWEEKGVIFGGRTDRAQIPKPLQNRLEDIFVVSGRRALYDKVFGPEDYEVILYGEGYGASINKGHGYLEDPHAVNFILFDIRIGDWWLQRNDVVDIARYLGLDVVEEFPQMNLYEAIELVSGDFKSNQFPNVEPEGLVGVPMVPLYTRGGSRIITKVKAKDFA